ncbi:hypothetical protein SAMN04487976_101257 [Xaviernesmea oryzae]|nr:hypothetical protein SAMN04487976_101257 [Xaviernesmea oryzae]
MVEAWFLNADRSVTDHCQKKFGESLTFGKTRQPLVIAAPRLLRKTQNRRCKTLNVLENFFARSISI